MSPTDFPTWINLANNPNKTILAILVAEILSIENRDPS